MKTSICAVLMCMLLLLGSAGIAQEATAMCGVVLVSDSMGGDWVLLEERTHLDAVLSCLDEDWRGIAQSVSNERIVDVCGGRELYLILPMDADASVSVVYLPGDEESLIYHSKTGEPFLLRCNAIASPWEEDPYLSDFVEVAQPFDCRVWIADSIGNVLIWNPYIHFNRGEINTDAQGGLVLDFTNYE